MTFILSWILKTEKQISETLKRRNVHASWNFYWNWMYVNGRENLLLKFIDFLLLLSSLGYECVFDFVCLQISLLLHGIWLRVIVISRIYYVHMLCLCIILPSYKSASYTELTYKGWESGSRKSEIWFQKSWIFHMLEL